MIPYVNLQDLFPPAKVKGDTMPHAAAALADFSKSVLESKYRATSSTYKVCYTKIVPLASPSDQVVGKYDVTVNTISSVIVS